MGTLKLIDFGTALVLGEGGAVKRGAMYDPFTSREAYLRQPCGFDVDLWYLAGVLYSLVHPKHHLPFSARPPTVTNFVDVFVASIQTQHRVSRRRPFRPLPAEVS